MGLPDVPLAEMPGDIGWLLAPVAAGWCRYEALRDGTLDLADVAIMNDALLVRAENERRITDAVAAARR